MNNTNNPLVIMIGILFVVALALGSWQVKRWFNWKYGYEGQVESQVEPLEKRIAELEKRVAALEKKP